MRRTEPPKSYLIRHGYQMRRFTREEEAALHRQMHHGPRSQRLAARQQLVESVLPWVVTLARKYAPQGQEIDDYIAIGNVHLCRQIDKFDPRRGRLTTFVARVLSRIYFSERDEGVKHRQEKNFPDALNLAATEAVEPREPDEEYFRCQRDVAAAIAELAPREQRIVAGRLQGVTLRQLGEELGVTRERIRQIETRAHGRLRTKLAHYQAVTQFGV